jgi:hypothetical protein
MTRAAWCDLLPHSTRNANPARLRKSLQPGRDIDGITEEILALHYDIADVDADPKTHLLTSRSARIFVGYGVLHRDRTLHGIDSAGEIGDEAIARCVEDPTAMRGDQAIDDDAVSCEGAKGADLIDTHEAAVPFDIGCEDRGKLPFDGVRFQGSAPPRSTIAQPGKRSERSYRPAYSASN